MGDCEAEILSPAAPGGNGGSHALGASTRRIHMKSKFQSGLFSVVILAAGFLAGCGGVSGSTYQAEGGAIYIAFHSGGKADFAMGPMKSTCSYTETSTTVSVTCDNQTITFDIKGNQIVPQQMSMIGALTKK
jgi:hypothetical protein